MDGPQDRLALIEVLERDGRVRRGFLVTRWPVSLGRALDNDLVIDDPHVAAQHCRIVQVPPEAEEGAPMLQLQVGATRNGVQVGPRTLVEGETAPLPANGESWQIGGTRLRVRLPGEPIEPERPLGLTTTGARPWVTAAVALAVWALVLIEHGVYLDPGSSLTDWLVPLLALPIGAVLWCVLWGIGSRVFQHRFEFWAHFAILTRGLLVIAVLDLLLPLLAFMLSWEWLSRINPAVSVVVAAITLYAHAALVVPVKRLVLAGGIAACVGVGGVIVATLNWQRTDRLFGEPYLATLPPPAFRLSSGVSVKEFVAEAADMRKRLDDRVAEEAPGKRD
ncbi:MAG: FHA domain-containing protein [Pseudomonadota bacterium]